MYFVIVLVVLVNINIVYLDDITSNCYVILNNIGLPKIDIKVPVRNQVFLTEFINLTVIKDTVINLIESDHIKDSNKIVYFLRKVNVFECTTPLFISVDNTRDRLRRMKIIFDANYGVLEEMTFFYYGSVLTNEQPIEGIHLEFMLNVKFITQDDDSTSATNSILPCDDCLYENGFDSHGDSEEICLHFRTFILRFSLKLSSDSILYTLRNIKYGVLEKRMRNSPNVDFRYTFHARRCVESTKTDDNTITKLNLIIPEDFRRNIKILLKFYSQPSSVPDIIFSISGRYIQETNPPIGVLSTKNTIQSSDIFKIYSQSDLKPSLNLITSRTLFLLSPTRSETIICSVRGKLVLLTIDYLNDRFMNFNGTLFENYEQSDVLYGLKKLSWSEIDECVKYMNIWRMEEDVNLINTEF